MASPSTPVTTAECDGYIPMSPRTFTFLNTCCNVETSTTPSPLICQPGNLAPPPIHRHLKPSLRRGENKRSTDWLSLALCGNVSFYFNSANRLCGFGLNDVLVHVLIHRHTVRVICIAMLMIAVNVSRRFT